MILMEDVYKKYPNGITAANGLNINIGEGEFVYVVGPVVLVNLPSSK